MLPLRQARLPRSPVPFQINAGLSICKSRRRLLYPRSSTLSFLFFSQIYSFTSLNCSPPPSAVRLSSIALLSSCSIIITQLRPTHLWYFRQPTPGSIFRIYLLWRWGMRNVCVCVWSWPRSNKAIPYLLYMYQHRFSQLFSCDIDRANWRMMTLIWISTPMIFGFLDFVGRRGKILPPHLVLDSLSRTPTSYYAME